MNRRIDKKTRRALFIGRPGNIMMPFWEMALKRRRNLLSSGVVRHSKKKEELVKGIKQLEYTIWEHETFWKRHRELQRRLSILMQEHGEAAMLDQIKSIKKEIDKEYWEAHKHEA